MITTQKESLLRRVRCYGNYILDSEEMANAQEMAASGWLRFDGERRRLVHITETGREVLKQISG